MANLPLIEIGEVCTHQYYTIFKDVVFPGHNTAYLLIPTSEDVTVNPPRYVGEDLGDDTTQKYLVVANPINPGGGMDVNIQDQTTRVVIGPFCRRVPASPAYKLASNPVINSYDIELVSVVGLTFGDTIGLFQDSTNPASFISDILAINTNVITVDSPLDVQFSVALDPTLFELDCELTVNGSVTAIPFAITNNSEIAIDITRVIFTITTFLFFLFLFK